MVTLTSLKRQVARERAKLDKEQNRQDMELEKRKLQGQLKVLKRSPSTKRNIAFLQKTADTIRSTAITGGKALLNQARLIKEQQLRDDALDRKFRTSSKNVAKAVKSTSTAQKKGFKRRAKAIKSKVKRKRR